jgi:WD40 repeat protein
MTTEKKEAAENELLFAAAAAAGNVSPRASSLGDTNLETSAVQVGAFSEQVPESEQQFRSPSQQQFQGDSGGISLPPPLIGVYPRRLLTATHDGTISIWNINTGKVCSAYHFFGSFSYASTLITFRSY